MTILRIGRAAGFTLIEVLVALAIVAIALLAALRAVAQSTTNVSELRGRLLAGWVAENLLAEHRALGEWIPLGIHRGKESQAGFEFAWRQEVVATPNQAFRRIDVFVYQGPGEDRALAHVTGFAVNPPVAAP